MSNLELNLVAYYSVLILSLIKAGTIIETISGTNKLLEREKRFQQLYIERIHKTMQEVPLRSMNGDERNYINLIMKKYSSPQGLEKVKQSIMTNPFLWDRYKKKSLSVIRREGMYYTETCDSIEREMKYTMFLHKLFFRFNNSDFDKRSRRTKELLDVKNLSFAKNEPPTKKALCFIDQNKKTKLEIIVNSREFLDDATGVFFLEDNGFNFKTKESEEIKDGIKKEYYLENTNPIFSTRNKTKEIKIGETIFTGTLYSLPDTGRIMNPNKYASGVFTKKLYDVIETQQIIQNNGTTDSYFLVLDDSAKKRLLDTMQIYQPINETDENEKSILMKQIKKGIFDVRLISI